MHFHFGALVFACDFFGELCYKKAYLVLILCLVTALPKFPRVNLEPLDVKEGDSALLECNPPTGVPPRQLYWMNCTGTVVQTPYIHLMMWTYMETDFNAVVRLKITYSDFLSCLNLCYCVNHIYVCDWSAKKTMHVYYSTTPILILPDLKNASANNRLMMVNVFRLKLWRMSLLYTCMYYPLKQTISTTVDKNYFS